MKKNKKVKYLAAAVTAAVLVIGMSIAYLTESDSLYNLFTVGEAKVDIDEGEFEQNRAVSPGQSSKKAPKAVNKGSIDEIVFMEVTLPQREISVLDDITQAPGDENAAVNPKKMQSLFFTAVDVGKTSDFVTEDGTEYKDFVYNTTEENGGSWIFLKSEFTAAKAATATTPAVDATRKFIFGYSGKLASGEDTSTIFDSVILKRFMEEDIAGGESVQIDVNAVCIQANNLDGHDTSTLDKDSLTDIYGICKNKGLTTQ